MLSQVIIFLQFHQLVKMFNFFFIPDFIFFFFFFFVFSPVTGLTTNTLSYIPKGWVRQEEHYKQMRFRVRL
ncbi:hypothetical protein CROQUDRAFT_527515 [Cronartium quercuum f. sp. fusiforme G11]|uniref:Uncharacterized protein n=1 Tax=Cronartium quercuum f. sp. fusiforme G11 TaxID=708437 RepID=A0A9P6NLK8_9BASI|nr:hypothetical protein CROQUDRAFT_527515 [Cronartium quercuum f. sp. fusiforme G11]